MAKQSIGIGIADSANRLSDNKNRDIARHGNGEHVCDNGGEAEGPAGVGAPTGPGDHPQNPREPEGVPLILSAIDRPTNSELRDQAAALLDAVAHQVESSRLNRIRYMRLGRQYGMTYSEIGEHVRMTEAGVRMALQRAAGDL